jgi:hypothetical protein
MKLIDRVLEIAYSEMKEGGNKKETEGSNSGPQVRKYLASVGITWPDQWCAAFVYYCINKVCINQNLKNLLRPTGYCPYIAEWGKNNKIYSSDPEKGDIFLLMDNINPPWKHTGFVTQVMSATVVKTIEGNTNNDGSANGDGIYERSRSTGSLAFVKWWKLYPDTGIPIVIDGKEITKGFLKDNNTYVPVRDLCEAMGYNVIWTNDKIIIRKG